MSAWELGYEAGYGKMPRIVPSELREQGFYGVWLSGYDQGQRDYKSEKI